MRVRRLDKDMDFSFGGNENDFYVDSLNAVAQSIYTRLKLLRGEFYLNEEEGVPLPQQFNIENSLLAIEEFYKQRILATNGVVSLESIKVSKDEENRVVTINYIVKSKYGLIEGQYGFNIG